MSNVIPPTGPPQQPSPINPEDNDGDEASEDIQASNVINDYESGQITQTQLRDELMTIYDNDELVDAIIDATTEADANNDGNPLTNDQIKEAINQGRETFNQLQPLPPLRGPGSDDNDSLNTGENDPAARAAKLQREARNRDMDESDEANRKQIREQEQLDRARKQREAQRSLKGKGGLEV